eukprot:639020_1
MEEEITNHTAIDMKITHDKPLIDYEVCDGSTHNIDDRLAHILLENNLYNSLFHILNENACSLRIIRQVIDRNEVDTFCNQHNLSTLQRVKFRTLIRKIRNYQDRSMDIIIIGDIGVGKTSLMRRYTHDIFDDNTVSNVIVDTYIKREMMCDDSIVKIQIWDTAGQEKFDSLQAQYYRNKHCVIICYDVSGGRSFDNLGKWRDKIKEHADDDVIVMLVGCKSDLSVRDRDFFEQKARSIIHAKEWKQFETLYCECSAKTGDNVRNVFRTAADMLLLTSMQNTVDDRDSCAQQTNETSKKRTRNNVGGIELEVGCIPRDQSMRSQGHCINCT